MNGSSMKRRSGPWRNAAASMSFWRVPFDRSRQIVPRASARAKNSIQRSIAAWRRGTSRTRPTKYRYSEAVRYDGGDSTSGTMPIAAFTLRGSRAGSMPRTRAVPPVGASWPVRTRRSVVLPAPFGPKRPKNSPESTSRSIPARAVTDPNRFTRPRASIAFTRRGSRVPLFEGMPTVIPPRRPRMDPAANFVPCGDGRARCPYPAGLAPGGRAHGPLRVRGEHVPEHHGGSPVQRERAAGMASGERGRGRVEGAHQSGCDNSPRGHRRPRLEGAAPAGHGGDDRGRGPGRDVRLRDRKS